MNPFDDALNLRRAMASLREQKRREGLRQGRAAQFSGYSGSGSDPVLGTAAGESRLAPILAGVPGIGDPVAARGFSQDSLPGLPTPPPKRLGVIQSGSPTGEPQINWVDFGRYYTAPFSYEHYLTIRSPTDYDYVFPDPPNRLDNYSRYPVFGQTGSDWVIGTNQISTTLLDSQRNRLTGINTRFCTVAGYPGSCGLGQANAESGALYQLSLAAIGTYSHPGSALVPNFQFEITVNDTVITAGVNVAPESQVGEQRIYSIYVYNLANPSIYYTILRRWPTNALVVYQPSGTTQSVWDGNLHSTFVRATPNLPTGNYGIQIFLYKDGYQDTNDFYLDVAFRIINVYA